MLPVTEEDESLGEPSHLVHQELSPWTSTDVHASREKIKPPLELLTLSTSLCLDSWELNMSHGENKSMFCHVIGTMTYLHQEPPPRTSADAHESINTNCLLESLENLTQSWHVHDICVGYERESDPEGHLVKAGNSVRLCQWLLMTNKESENQESGLKVPCETIPTFFPSIRASFSGVCFIEGEDMGNFLFWKAHEDLTQTSSEVHITLGNHQESRLWTSIDARTHEGWVILLKHPTSSWINQCLDAGLPPCQPYVDIVDLVHSNVDGQELSWMLYNICESRHIIDISPLIVNSQETLTGTLYNVHTSLWPPKDSWILYSSYLVDAVYSEALNLGTCGSNILTWTLYDVCVSLAQHKWISRLMSSSCSLDITMEHSQDGIDSEGPMPLLKHPTTLQATPSLIWLHHTSSVSELPWDKFPMLTEYRNSRIVNLEILETEESIRCSIELTVHVPYKTQGSSGMLQCWSLYGNSPILNTCSQISWETFIEGEGMGIILCWQVQEASTPMLNNIPQWQSQGSLTRMSASICVAQGRGDDMSLLPAILHMWGLYMYIVEPQNLIVFLLVLNSMPHGLLLMSFAMFISPSVKWGIERTFKIGKVVHKPSKSLLQQQLVGSWQLIIHLLNVNQRETCHIVHCFTICSIRECQTLTQCAVVSRNSSQVDFNGHCHWVIGSFASLNYIEVTRGHAIRNIRSPIRQHNYEEWMWTLMNLHINFEEIHTLLAFKPSPPSETMHHLLSWTPSGVSFVEGEDLGNTSQRRHRESPVGMSYDIRMCWEEQLLHMWTLSNVCINLEEQVHIGWASTPWKFLCSLCPRALWCGCELHTSLYQNDQQPWMRTSYDVCVHLEECIGLLNVLVNASWNSLSSLLLPLIILLLPALMSHGETLLQSPHDTSTLSIQPSLECHQHISRIEEWRDASCIAQVFPRTFSIPLPVYGRNKEREGQTPQSRCTVLARTWLKDTMSHSLIILLLQCLENRWKCRLSQGYVKVLEKTSCQTHRVSPIQTLSDVRKNMEGWENVPMTLYTPLLDPTHNNMPPRTFLGTSFIKGEEPCIMVFQTDQQSQMRTSTNVRIIWKIHQSPTRTLYDAHMVWDDKRLQIEHGMVSARAVVHTKSWIYTISRPRIRAAIHGIPHHIEMSNYTGYLISARTS